MMLPLPSVTLLLVGEATPENNKAWNDSVISANFGDVVTIPSLPSYRQYNDWCITDLHKHFATEFVLLIQSDGFVVRPEAWTDEFLEYDYIGAVMWSGFVGNGGFSLRSKRFCEASAKLDLTKRDFELCRRMGIEEEDFYNEDLILCIEKRQELEAMGVRFAPIELADRFSWESSKIRPSYTGSFGFHSPASLAELKRLGIL